MKFATLKDGSLDGRLLLVSRDGLRAAAVPTEKAHHVATAAYT